MTEPYIYEPRDEQYLRDTGQTCMNYYYDRLTIARSLGFDNVIDAMQYTYRKFKSTRLAGEAWDMSGSSFSKHMAKSGEPIRPRGGANNTGKYGVFHGRECPTCGGTERYVSDRHCRPCTIRRNLESYYKKKARKEAM